MTELTPEQAQAAKDYAAEEVQKMVDEKAGDIQAKVDAAYAAGLAAGAGEDRFYFNSDKGVSRKMDSAYEAYEGELRLLVSELEKEGIPRSQARNHPRVRALELQHGR